MAVPKKKPVSSGARGAAPAPVRAPEKWPFGKKNYILFGIALAVITLGFVFLGTGDITLAPILLVIGYCVLVPWAILAKDKSKEPVVPAEATQSEPKVS